jgi:hypothetical protein
MRAIVCEARLRGFHPRGSAPVVFRRDLVTISKLTVSNNESRYSHLHVYGQPVLNVPCILYAYKHHIRAKLQWPLSLGESAVGIT